MKTRSFSNFLVETFEDGDFDTIDTTINEPVVHKIKHNFEIERGMSKIATSVLITVTAASDQEAHSVAKREMEKLRAFMDVDYGDDPEQQIAAEPIDPDAAAVHAFESRRNLRVNR